MIQIFRIFRALWNSGTLGADAPGTLDVPGAPGGSGATDIQDIPGTLGGADIAAERVGDWPMIEKRGRLAEIIFRNEENFYTVAVVENDEQLEQFIAVGNLPAAKCGMTFCFKGEWKNHPSYGEQFAFYDCSEEVPRSEEGIRTFLSSGVIKGIGPKMAEAIVSRFGEKTLEVIEQEPGRLTEVDGIGDSKARLIIEGYRAHREFADISLFFANYGISSAYAMRMYKIYGAETVSAVMENPYRLITDIRGIGFRQADEIAEKLGIERDSEYRLTSGIRYLMGRYAADGNTYVPFREFYEEAGQMLDVPSQDIRDMAEQLVIDGYVRIEDCGGVQAIFLSAYFEAENNVARRLFSLHSAEIKPVKSDIGELIRMSESSTGILLSDNQRAAVCSCAENGVCVITGGPGTGKTTIINTMIDVFETCGFRVAIAAPTGRAAKRISETSGRAAVTIHRLLEYYYSEDSDSMSFGKNAEDPLDYDVAIIDEMSMVDVLLMDALTEAIRSGTRLILVGDADQLPSVGAGNVLRDIISSEIIPTVRLTEIFRQAGESMIVVNAHRINRGEYPYCNEKDRDFFLMRRNSEASVLATIKELCSRRLPAYYGECDPLRDIQVLTPVRKGTLGTHNMNRELQAILNPPAPGKAEKELQNRIFRVGDKVMQIKNNYRLEWKRSDTLLDGEGVYNGDIGFVRGIDYEDGKMTVVFDDVKYVEYEFNQTEELELAYAMTVHKSQGSEFAVVVMPMAYFPPMLANRNLLYTGVTRGKTAVVLVGSERMMHGMIDNNRIDERYSGLGMQLRKFLILEDL